MSAAIKPPDTASSSDPRAWAAIAPGLSPAAFDRLGLAAAAVILVVKGLFLVASNRSAGGDEAITGLMALHILSGRDAPIFFYGQTYLGSIEPIVAAGLLGLAGISTGVLRLTPLLFQGVWVATVFALSRAWLPPGWAGVAALVAALPPAIAAYLSATPLGGSGSLTMALAWLAVWTGWRIGRPADRRAGRLDWLLFGVTGGLALWNHLLAVAGVVVGSWLARRGRPTAGHLGMTLLGFLLGFSPWLVWNLTHGWATLAFLQPPPANRGTVLEVALDAVTTRVEHLVIYVQYGLPGALGIVQPYSDQPYGIGLLLLPFWLVSAGLWLAGRAATKETTRQRARRLGPTLGVALVASALFVGGGWEARDGPMNVRYLVALAGAAPFWAAWTLAELRQRSARLAWVSGGLLLAVLAVQNFQILVAGPLGTFESARLVSRDLLSAGITRIYAPYWVAYPITWESQERVIASSRHYVPDRYEAYTRAVDGAPEPGFLVCAGSPADEYLTETFTDRQMSFERTPIAPDQVIYTAIRPDPRGLELTIPEGSPPEQITCQ